MPAIQSNAHRPPMLPPASVNEIADLCILDVMVSATPFSRPHRPSLVVWIDAEAKTVTRWEVLPEDQRGVVFPAPHPSRRVQGMVEIWFRNLQIHLGQLDAPLTPPQLDTALREYIELYNQIVTEMAAS